MVLWQKLIVLAFGLLSILGFMKGLYESKQKRNSLGKVGMFNIIGAFVWADAVIFGIFWALTSAFAYFTSNWLLFLTALSVFWLIRSLGETMYWINQQFSPINRNPAKQYWFYNVFHDEYTVWFVFQIFWQVVTVISLVFTVYFVHLWLR